MDEIADALALVAKRLPLTVGQVLPPALFALIGTHMLLGRTRLCRSDCPGSGGDRDTRPRTITNPATDKRARIAPPSYLPPTRDPLPTLPTCQPLPSRVMTARCVHRKAVSHAYRGCPVRRLGARPGRQSPVGVCGRPSGASPRLNSPIGESR